MTLVTRIRELADEKKVTFAEIERAIGISNGQIRRWDKVSPKSENLKKVADYFGVSTDYLLGSNKVPKWANNDDLVELDKMLNSNVNMAYGGEMLTDEEKQRVKDVLTGLFWEFRKRDKEM